jgi:error-prone DNA polymerase
MVGARLVFADATPDILAYPQTRAGWGRLCRLLTLGNSRAKKGECILTLDDLTAAANDLLLIVMPERRIDDLRAPLARLADAAPGAVWIAASMPRRGNDVRRLARLKTMARETGLPLIAVNDVLYHEPRQRDLQDVLTCIREGVTIGAVGRKLEANAERHLKEPAEMARLFRAAPEAIEEIGHILDRIDFSLDHPSTIIPTSPSLQAGPPPPGLRRSRGGAPPCAIRPAFRPRSSSCCERNWR